MKIRNGFVSNSSSSSFMVATKEKIKDKADLLKLLGVLKGSLAEKLFEDFIMGFINSDPYTDDSLRSDFGLENFDTTDPDEYGRYERMLVLVHEGWDVRNVCVERGTSFPTITTDTFKIAFLDD